MNDEGRERRRDELMQRLARAEMRASWLTLILLIVWFLILLEI